MRSVGPLSVAGLCDAGAATGVADPGHSRKRIHPIVSEDGMLFLLAMIHASVMAAPIPYGNPYGGVYGRSTAAPGAAPSAPVAPRGVVPLVGLPGAGRPAPEQPKPTPEEARIASLHTAAFEGDLRTVKAILADHPELVDRPPVFREGGKNVPSLSTPLHGAAVKGHTDIVRFLLEEGADPDAKTTDGTTPLHYAATCGHAEAVRLLLGKKADPNARKAEGWTPLHNAAMCGRTEIALLLIKAGADVEAKTQYLPEREIALAGQPENARPVILPASPARTPADVARDAGHEELAKLLTPLKG